MHSLLQSRPRPRPCSDDSPLSHLKSKRRLPSCPLAIADAALVPSDRLVDSTVDYQAGRYATVLARLQQDGVIVVRGIISSSIIAAGRQLMIQQRNGTVLKSSDGRAMKSAIAGAAPIGRDANGHLVSGITVDAESGGAQWNSYSTAPSSSNKEEKERDKQWARVGNSPELTAIYNGTALHQFYSNLFTPTPAPLPLPTPTSTCPSALHSTPAPFSSSSLPSIANGLTDPSTQTIVSGDRHATITPHYTTFPGCTWLRMKGRNEPTSAHTDYYYFKQATNIFRNHWQPITTNSTSSSSSRSPSCASSSSSSSLSSPSSSSCSSSNSSSSSFSRSLLLPPPSDVDDISVCRICKQDEDPERVLLCDLCEHGYHLDCLSSPLTRVPSEEEGEWHCAQCANSDFPYYTCWIAMGNIGAGDGPLYLIPGSHREQGYDYKPGREARLPTAFNLREADRDSKWKWIEMKEGDVILFNIKTIHKATGHRSDEYRISCDTRVTTGKGRRWADK